MHAAKNKLLFNMKGQKRQQLATLTVPHPFLPVTFIWYMYWFWNQKGNYTLVVFWVE
jgi:hypothetical protein